MQNCIIRGWSLGCTKSSWSLSSRSSRFALAELRRAFNRSYAVVSDTFSYLFRQCFYRREASRASFDGWSFLFLCPFLRDSRMSFGAGYLWLPKYSFEVKYGYRARVVNKRLYKSDLVRQAIDRGWRAVTWNSIQRVFPVCTHSIGAQNRSELGQVKKIRLILASHDNYEDRKCGVDQGDGKSVFAVGQP